MSNSNSNSSSNSAIHVAGLSKIYQVPEREAGLAASIKSLVKRKTKDVKAVDAISFEIAPGVYTVQAQTPVFWYLTAVTCDPAAAGLFDEATQSLAISVAGGQAVTCTFVNQHAGEILVRKYHDRNGDGARTDEPGLRGWQITLYGADGAPVAIRGSAPDGPGSL